MGCECNRGVFKRPYPANKSRKIFLHILEECKIVSAFDKNSNYDRLFPNQDYHTGKGLGNLIALPLQKQALQNNNSCFIETETLQIASDQWRFLKGIKKAGVEQLDKIYNSISESTFTESVHQLSKSQYQVAAGLFQMQQKYL